MKDIDIDHLKKYLFRAETREEKSGLPVVRPEEKRQAYELLPNTPLMKDAALEYGALMFALGRRQVTMEVEAWMKEQGIL